MSVDKDLRLHSEGFSNLVSSAIVILRIKAARYVPPPPGADLEARLRDLIAWMQTDHGGRIDPAVAAGMGHYEFEALHPFHDGNGRLGRLFIVLQLHASGALIEPTLSVST